WARSDHPMDVWDYTKDQPGKRGILGAYLSGSLAERVTYMAPADATRAILGMIDQIHPGARENFETAARKSWIDDPWSLGAAVAFKAGQMGMFLPHLGTPEGRFHFAGEHTSPWAAWMQGALQSGNRVAKEIEARSGAVTQ